MRMFLIAVIAILALFLIAGCAKSNVDKDFMKQYQAEVFYSPTCGCCMNYLGHLRESGLDVKATKVADTVAIKDKLNIPAGYTSCHTTKVGDYFVEGHVPAEAIEKLLKEKPDIDGIALPGMPSGSPGMPGPKVTFNIIAIKDGQSQGTFMVI